MSKFTFSLPDWPVTAVTLSADQMLLLYQDKGIDPHAHKLESTGFFIPGIFLLFGLEEIAFGSCFCGNAAQLKRSESGERRLTTGVITSRHGLLEVRKLRCPSLLESILCTA